jgi:hypothetical protein
VAGRHLTTPIIGLTVRRLLPSRERSGVRGGAIAAAHAFAAPSSSHRCATDASLSRRGRGNCWPIAAALLALIGAAGDVAAANDSPLPPLCIDEAGVSVSGISSGGFMAHQFHVAHSARVMGAAIFAGGPLSLCRRRLPGKPVQISERLFALRPPAISRPSRRAAQHRRGALGCGGGRHRRHRAAAGRSRVPLLRPAGYLRAGDGGGGRPDLLSRL